VQEAKAKTLPSAERDHCCASYLLKMTEDDDSVVSSASRKADGDKGTTDDVPFTVMDLGLRGQRGDDDDDDDEDEVEDHPRRLLKLPGTGEILAYGGEDGTICKLNLTDQASSKTVWKHWDDDAVRALGVSQDGRTVAVGFDNGSTTLFTFPDFDVTSASQHPFCLGSKDKGVAGPCFDAPVRDIQFHPVNTEYMAVATESGFCVLSVQEITDNASARAKRTLEEESEKQHDGSGIRSLVFHQLASSKVALASLAMDGRLCLWDCTGEPSEWKLIEREKGRCITKQDVGEILGADAWDRSCHNVMADNMAALPGETYLQLRRLCVSDDEVKCTAYDQPPLSDATPVQGHVETIVALATSPNYVNDKYLVTTGRDKRVIMWRIHQRKVRLMRWKSPEKIGGRRCATHIHTPFSVCSSGRRFPSSEVCTSDWRIRVSSDARDLGQGQCWRREAFDCIGQRQTCHYPRSCHQCSPGTCQGRQVSRRNIE
jgi:WD40 repeat protein